MRLRSSVALFAMVVVLVNAAPTNKWNKMKDEDWDRLDDEWKDGDEEAELVSEDQIAAREYERRQATLSPETVADLANGAGSEEEQLRHKDSLAGPSMQFVILQPTDENNEPWELDNTNELLDMWREQLFTAGITVSCYRLDGRILVTLQRGWDGFAVRNYLVERPEVLSVEWDNHVYPGKHADVSHTRLHPKQVREMKRKEKEKAKKDAKKKNKNKNKNKNNNSIKTSGAGKRNPTNRREDKDAVHAGLEAERRAAAKDVPKGREGDSRAEEKAATDAKEPRRAATSQSSASRGTHTASSRTPPTTPTPVLPSTKEEVVNELKSKPAHTGPREPTSGAPSGHEQSGEL